MAFSQGFFSKENAGGRQALGSFLPDSNSRLYHVANDFIIAILCMIDPRLKDFHVQEALAHYTKCYYDELGTLCPIRYSWCMLLLCYTAAVDPDDKVPSRHKQTFITMILARIEVVKRSLTALPLTLNANKQIMLNWYTDGVYKKGDPDDTGVIHKLHNVNGVEVLIDCDDYSWYFMVEVLLGQELDSLIEFLDCFLSYTETGA